jgi:hypothetical protein
MAQPIPESLKQSSLPILIAIADPNASGVPPDLGRHKQKTQSRDRQRRMLELSLSSATFAVSSRWNNSNQ